MSDLHDAALGHALREAERGQLIDAKTLEGFEAVFGRMPPPFSSRAAGDAGTHDALHSPAERVPEPAAGRAGPPYNWPRANTGD